MKKPIGLALEQSQIYANKGIDFAHKAAECFIGVTEATGNNDGDVFVFTGMRQEPWCAHFVAFIFNLVGCTLPMHVRPTKKTANPLASCRYLDAVLRKNNYATMRPIKNGIVIFKSRMQSDPGRGWHTGIITDVASDQFSTIEGNTGDSVKIKIYDVTNKNIVGFYYPSNNI